jgi:hypothetical protein
VGLPPSGPEPVATRQAPAETLRTCIIRLALPCNPDADAATGVFDAPVLMLVALQHLHLRFLWMTCSSRFNAI